MAEFLHLTKGKFLNFTLTFIASFFFLATGWGQTVTSDKADYAPGETAIITGEGWTGDAIVNVHFNETPEVDDFHQWHNTPVDSGGNFVINFPILVRHLGVAFEVEVVGATTGREAFAYFTDANVRFGVNGLPGNTNLTVNYSGTNAQGNQVTSSVTFSNGNNANGTSSAIALVNNLEFTYPSSIIIGSDIYNLISTNPTSPTNVPATGNFPIIATYEIQGGSGGLNITTNECAQGGEFTITYSPTSGSPVTVTRTTPFSFEAKKNTTYSISSIQGTVNCNTYT